MAIPATSCDHAAGLVDSPAKSADPMMAFSFRQYDLPEPVMEIVRYHLYEQIQFIAFIINLAVLTECEARFDFINRGLNGASLIIIVKDLCCSKIINVCYDCLVFVPTFVILYLLLGALSLSYCSRCFSSN